MKLSSIEPADPEHPLRAELIRAILEYEADRPRSKQRRVGPSEVGTPCARQLAYKLLDEPRVNVGASNWAAIVGTACHDMMERALKRINRVTGQLIWIVEHRVQMRVGLDGSTDAYHVPRGNVVDHKFVGKDQLRHYRLHGPHDQYRAQAHLYGKGWINLGLPVNEVCIAFYPRTASSLADTYVWSEPFDMRIADAAIERMDNVLALADSLDVESHPERYTAIPKTPHDLCRYCPWHRPGPDTGRSCGADKDK